MKPTLDQIFATQPIKPPLSEIFGVQEAPKPSLVEGIKSDFRSRVDKASESQMKSIQGEQSLGSGALQTIGQGAGFIGDIAMQGIKAITPEPVEKAVTKGVQKIVETKPVQDIATRYTEWATQNPEASANLEASLNIASLIPGAKGVTQTTEAVGKGVSKIAKATGNVISDVTTNATKYPKQIVETISEKITPLDSKVKNVLETTDINKFESYVKAGEDAVNNPRSQTPLELAGEKLADSTIELKNRMSEAGKAKSAILEPLRQGLDSFKKETNPFIQELTKLKNSFSEIDAGQKSVVQSIINDAKTVSTKLDADKLVDKIQDALYSGNTNQTIVGGSSLDKQLRRILGEYNSNLKKSLPTEYTQLNDKYSKYADVLSTLNRSLGETVEGVPVRGASLIKQFFSPSGTKSKEIFKFIKDELGIDLAEDATIAKFVMDSLGDVRAKSLLEQIPVTPAGVIMKGIEKIEKKLTRPIEKARKTIQKRESKSKPTTPK